MDRSTTFYTIITELIIGIVVLIIEYWTRSFVIAFISLVIVEYRTGWFTNYFNLPNLKTIIKDILENPLKLLPYDEEEVYWKAKYLTIPIVLVAFLCVSFAIENNVNKWLIISVIAIACSSAFIALRSLSDPEKTINRVIIVACALILILLFLPIVTITPSPITATSFKTEKYVTIFEQIAYNIRTPYLKGVRQIIVVITAGIFWVTWRIATVLVEFTSDSLLELEGQLVLLHDSPEIAIIIDKVANTKIKEVKENWRDFLTKFSEIDEDASDVLQHVVPVSFAGHVLRIACLTQREVMEMMDSDEGENDETIRDRIENALRFYFKNDYITIECEVVSRSIFENLRLYVI